MAKKIWIMNHYATPMLFNEGGRHYWFAKYLREKNFNVEVFGANDINTGLGEVNIQNFYEKKEIHGNEIYLVKTTRYSGNGFSRIKNMLVFAYNLFKAGKDLINKGNRPDVILASSVHPFTLVSGLRLAKKYHIPCICEIRDLWPESIVAYTKYTKKNLAIKAMYALEKWIYKNCDSLVFSFSGGEEYIKKKGWDSKIDLSKIHYINTGIDLEKYKQNLNDYKVEDDDLENDEFFKVIYVGSIRIVNNIIELVNVARLLENTDSKIKIIIYGSGDEKDKLEKICRDEGLTKIAFKGRVNKNQIPYILSKADLQIVNLKPNKVLPGTGESWNKLFEYMASGKPTLSNAKSQIINKYNIGISKNNLSTEEYLGEILNFKNMPKEEYDRYCKRATETAEKFDSKMLTDKLIKCIDQIVTE